MPAAEVFEEQRRRDDDPIGGAPLLHIELILYVARTEKRRPEPARRLRARRELMVEMIEGVRRAAKTQDIPEDSFMRSVAQLQQLIDRAATQTTRK